MVRWFPLLAALALPAADWTQFRGSNGSGVSPSKNVPERFDTQRNLIWRTPLPAGHSSPVFTEDRIFVTAFEGRELLTICLDRATGKIQWRRPAPRERQESYQPTNGPASPSPVTDGSNVYAFFGDFGLLSYGPDGNERWRLPLGPFNNPNGHGSSPILADGKLVLICDQDTDSFLVAVDPSNGHVLWKIPRPEYTRGYATPAVYRPKSGPAELIVPVRSKWRPMRSIPARNCGGYAGWRGSLNRSL
jgi:outer membrane protein assembly factor BamB